MRCIEKALARFPKDDVVEASKRLLRILGYQSERVLMGQSGQVEDFVNAYPLINKQSGENAMTKSNKSLIDGIKSIQILFQLTDEELKEIGEKDEEQDSFDDSNIHSFLFIVVELKQGEKDSYPRGRYAEFVQEINKRFPMPVVVLFKTASNLLTLAFVYRRPNKVNSERDVIGRVSLIREINTSNPDRIHLDILKDLALEIRLKWIIQQGKDQNFDNLLVSWLDALDTEKLNRKFYQELFEWFKRAMGEANLPKIEMKAEEQVIRLITRILFVWFIKEKGLVAEELFIENQVKKYLNDYDPENGDSYYRAVLQNLFFATLNTEIDRRRFSKVDRTTHRNFSYYRFKEEIADVDGLLNLFNQSPFINGGLFECLDSFENYGYGGSRVDFFTDNVNNPNEREYKKISFPNRLFFDNKRGLFPLFGRYKFTIEENTPIEKEVALDPELMGKAFENLLAAHIPETRDNARKQTGSYYTPTPVVEYMVDEVLVERLAGMVLPADDNVDRWKERLRYLLDYEDAYDNAEKTFESMEMDGLVRAVSEIKVIDPAVGSGAFPMGILHKLTLMLRRLDPNNERWQDIQKERAMRKVDTALDKGDPHERAKELAEISSTFQLYRDSDFGRKLYLIQNSIFGVDVQPIACQITKLRFFISLAIEQDPSDDRENNYGIKPLPNLETQFVAADTLIGLDRPKQGELQTPTVLKIEQEIANNKERIFHANTRDRKWNYRKRDKTLRRQLATALQESGFSTDASDKITNWDLSNQNVSSKWFDAEHMFGIRKGFDIVIGNPPYVQLQKDGGKLADLYKGCDYSTFTRTGDVYQLFYEKGCQLLDSQKGLLCFITSNSWLRSKYGKTTRSYFADRHSPLLVLEMGKDVFENAIVDTNIIIIRAGKSDDICKGIDMDSLFDQTFPPTSKYWGNIHPNGDKPWKPLSTRAESIMSKMESKGTPLISWDISVARGITTGLNNAFIIDEIIKEEIIAKDPNSHKIIVPMLRGRDIHRYQACWSNLWLIYARRGTDIDYYPAVLSHLEKYENALSLKAGDNHWYELQASPGDKVDAIFRTEKLFWMDLTDRGRFVYVKEPMFCNNTAFVMAGDSLKYLCAVLNSKLISWFMQNTALTSGMGTPRWVIFTVNQVPIPKISLQEQNQFNILVEKIFSIKATNPSADTSKEEDVIDRLVYELYGLSKDEIAVVEEMI